MSSIRPDSGSSISNSRISPPKNKTTKLNEETGGLIQIKNKLSREIAFSRKLRGERVKRLPEKERGLLNDLDVDFNLFSGRFLSLIQFKSEIKKKLDTCTSESEEERLYEEEDGNIEKFLDFVEDIEKKYFKKTINMKLKKYSEYLVNIFSDKQDQISELKLRFHFHCEQVLNGILNGMSFNNEMNQFLQKNMKEIFEFFNKKHLNCIDQINFKTEKQGGERHNRGKVPTKVTFFLGSKKILQVFLKPRNSKLDLKVIDLFNSINRIYPKKPRLPVYKICNFNYERKAYSIWEFINGKCLEGDFVPSESSTIMDHEKKAALLNKMMWMESILRRINISDLHGENVIFREVNGDPEVVPIDLESIQEGFPTGLFGQKMPALQPLSKEGMKLISDFKDSVIPNCQFRVVPLATQKFMNAKSNYKTVPSLAKEIIGLKKYFFNINPSELEDLILGDIINSDIPFLTEFEGKLYYGVPESGKLIGKTGIKDTNLLKV